MPMVTRNCKYCSTEFETRQAQINRGYGKFCSRSCNGKYTGLKRRKQIEPNETCAFCDENIYISPGRRKRSKSGLFFCNRECKDKAQRYHSGVDISPAHYNGGNYREAAFRHYPARCAVCGYNKHKEVLHVHHKDRDRSNNELDNLIILCPTHHTENHFEAGDGGFNVGPQGIEP